MHLTLYPHPDTPSRAVTRISVDAARDRRPRSGQHEVLILRYVVDLARDGLVLPEPTAAQRIDGLWKHTCLEAFIRASGNAYHEFNFSPSTQWAAYSFDDYRAGMSPLEISSPRIMTIGGHPPRYEVRVSVDLSSVSGLGTASPWRLALSAVIEETGGEKSYWALAHPPGKPDFHHADGFVLELP